MANYRFVTNGSFIEFYDDAQLVESLPVNYTGFSWQYNDRPGIAFSFNGHVYWTDNLEDILFNGVPLASQAGFKTALGVLFPHFSGSAGGSIDNLTDDWTLDMDGHDIKFQQGAVSLFEIDQSNGLSRLRSRQGAGATLNQAETTAAAGETESSNSMSADFNDGTKRAAISLQAVIDASKIEFESDSFSFSVVQAFADNAAAVTGGLEVGMIYRTGDALKIVHV